MPLHTQYFSPKVFDQLDNIGIIGHMDYQVEILGTEEMHLSAFSQQEGKGNCNDCPRINDDHEDLSAFQSVGDPERFIVPCDKLQGVECSRLSAACPVNCVTGHCNQELRELLVYPLELVRDIDKAFLV